jgi:rod shape-determining protein MreC
VATAARSSSRTDAALLVGCVVVSLIAIALPGAERGADGSIASEGPREAVAGALRRTVVAPLVGLQRGSEKWRTAWASGEQQQLVIDSLSMRATRLQALQVENDQLRKLMGLGTRLGWGFVPAEALHSTTPNDGLVTTITLTAGSTAGVARYSPVVSSDGLVGTIRNADPTMSIAILYTDKDFAASAMSSDGNAFGIVYPHPARVGGGDAYMLELRDVPTRVTLKPGAVIYTSGLGGTFPRGITIGTIVQELKTAEVWTRTYLVRPAVSPSRVNFVLILSPQRVTQGTGNIWGAGVNGDSASRRIAAAGDSLAKQAALLQAQARQAALDSMKRATIDSVRRSLGAPPLAPAATDSAGRGAQRAPTAGGTPGARRDTTRVRRDTLRPDSTRTPRP